MTSRAARRSVASMKHGRFAALAAVLSLAIARPAAAWEPSTTQPGLAEQAALESRLHKRLVLIGFGGGLFEQLTIPPADAPTLIAALKLLSPTNGSVPDGRGRQSALAWLAAGASLADVPSKYAANHFYDPTTGKGWEAPDRSVLQGLSDRVRRAIGRVPVPRHGMPATQWITAKDNPFNLDNFLDQYGKAVSAATPGERSRHMAAALIAAGAMLHVLGDLGAPSRVRGDAAAHFDELGAGPDDLGSRFERIAALAYGRLGVPAPTRTVTRTHLLDFFTSKDGTGLADMIASHYFSPHTLPAPSRVSGDAAPVLARPAPKLPKRLNVMAATRDGGTVLRNSEGTCLAQYHVENDILRFSLDDRCMLEQIAEILPEVAAYETGLLDFLLRGELTITGTSVVSVAGKALGTGKLEVLAEDNRGVRTKLAEVAIDGKTAKPGAPFARVAAPSNALRVVAVFRGTDAAGEPVVAVGGLQLNR